MKYTFDWIIGPQRLSKVFCSREDPSFSKSVYDEVGSLTRSATYRNWLLLIDQAGGSRTTRDRRDTPWCTTIGPIWARGSLFIYKSLETAVFSSICSECPRTRAPHHHEQKKPPLKMSSDKTPLDQSLEDFLRFTGNLDDAVCPDNSPRGQASANKKKADGPNPSLHPRPGNDGLGEKHTGPALHRVRRTGRPRSPLL